MPVVRIRQRLQCLEGMINLRRPDEDVEAPPLAARLVHRFEAHHPEVFRPQQAPKALLRPADPARPQTDLNLTSSDKLPLATDVTHPAAIMHVCHSDASHRTEAQQAVISLVNKSGFASNQVEALERYAFYEKIKVASLIVQTGEGTAYGNAMFCKGVILL